MSESTTEQWGQWAATLESDPGAAIFPAFAESHRRAERFEEAESTARAGLACVPESEAGRLVLALCLLDQGRIREARNEFGRVTELLLARDGVSVPAQLAETVSESEWDAAFDAAETDRDALIDPNRIAEEAVASVDQSAASGLPEDAAGHEEFSNTPLVAGSAFATASMATLLERQGDEASAARIRQELDTLAPSLSSDEKSEEPLRRAYWIQELERWLLNLRGASR